MTNNEGNLLFASVVLGFIVGLIGGAWICSNNYEREAIKNNVAYYHPETGEFTWKDKATEVEK